MESLITDVVSKKAEKRMPTHHDTSDAHQQHQRAEFSGGAYIYAVKNHILHCSLISTCLLENVDPFSVYRRGHHVAVNYAKVSRICILATFNINSLSNNLYINKSVTFFFSRRH
jgi:hypothetical protein